MSIGGGMTGVVSRTLLQREMPGDGELIDWTVFGPKVIVKPEETLTLKRAEHFFGSGLVTQKEVFEALSPEVEKIFGFQLANKPDSGFTVTERHAAVLAGGNWMCVYLPILPLGVIVELVKAAGLQEQLLPAIASYVKTVEMVDINDLVNRVMSLGLGGNRQSGYVFISREPIVNINAGEAQQYFDFSRVLIDKMWSLLLIQFLLKRELVRYCDYESFGLRPGGKIILSQGKVSANGASVETKPLAFADKKIIQNN
ncbi:MAG: hypothetical protein AAB766_04085 [Patescibacteria group bacterium]